MERLANALVIQVAQNRGLDKKDAVDFIRHCLLKISAETDTDYSTLNELLYSFTGLAYCLAESCSRADLLLCQKLCHCIVFESKCVPRYLKDAGLINQDPDRYVKSMSTPDLEYLVKYTSYLYYNYDGGGLTDNAFDALQYHLNKRLKAKGRRYEKIGAPPIKKLRAKLPYPMASLTKLKPHDAGLLQFLKDSQPFGLVWSEKLDGVSGMVIFKGGQIESIYTRGDGETGGNVSYLGEYIKFPKPDLEYLVVRGEFVMSKRTFADKYKDTYSNPRSLVSAKINSGFISPALPDIDFVAYQIVAWSEKKQLKPSRAFKYLVAQGFKTAVNGLMPKGTIPLIFDLVSLYKHHRETSEYNIDGLVISQDRPESLESLANPKYSKAFKMLLEEQMRRTRVTNVEWNISRHGRYVPVAIYESVYIDDIRLHRASAHNAAHIRDWNMGKGTKVTIVRSGDVIPHIRNVITDPATKAIFPDDKYVWHWESRDIILDEIENNPNVQIKRLLYFFQTLQVRGIGEVRSQRLWEAGFQDIQAVTLASKSSFKAVKGFGPKTVETVYNSLHETMRKTRLDRYFKAITTFKSRISSKLFREILRENPAIINYTSAQITDYLQKHKIKGVGPKRQVYLAETIPAFKAELFKLNPQDIAAAIKHQETRQKQLEKRGYNKQIQGKTFVMTGFMDHPNYEIEDYIWDNFGELSTTVISSTAGVIAASMGNITDKMIKAHDMDINVYSVTEFTELVMK